MSTYAEKLKDPRWQKKRLKIMERDKYTCRDCGSTENTLHIHHCHYQKGNPWDTDNSFLLTLCEGCHGVRGKLEEQVKADVGELLARTPIDLLKRVVAATADGDAIELISRKKFTAIAEAADAIAEAMKLDPWGVGQ